MSRPDLNLLVSLDVVLAEGNVARAAKRLNLSPSAMSRALARLRETTGDPLLVRAGRGLVPTPRALELREQVAHLVAASEALLRPAAQPNLRHLDRTFTLRTSDGFVENFGPALVARMALEAPGVRLRFMQKLDKESGGLRDGTVDLETGVVEGMMGPEVRSQALFRDTLIGVVRAGHPLAKGKMTLARYAKGRHVSVTRRGVEQGLIDDALAASGVSRTIAAVVTGFAAAIALARESDLIASVPKRHTENLRSGLFSFRLPFPTSEFTVSLLWHPRMHADPAHRWLRACVQEVCSGG
ncbi:MAG TPA: LysR family transcriptional regulator [Geothrix sp.]|nr:LysR family transcriptional regulator [Geothrix sp.]